MVKQELLTAQFTIVKDDGDKRCHNVITIVTPPFAGDGAASTTRKIPDWLTQRGSVTTRRGGGPWNTTYGPEGAVTYRVSTGGPNTQVEGPNSQGVGQSLGGEGDSSGAGAGLWRTNDRLPLCVPVVVLALLVLRRLSVHAYLASL